MDLEIEIPDPDRVDDLRRRIARAWRNEPIPAPEQTEVRDVLGEVNRHFSGKRWDEVDLESSYDFGDTPLTAMDGVAAKYYAQAFLQHCLNLNRHAQATPKACWDEGGISAISYFGNLHGTANPELFNAEQRQVIMDFLKLVLDYPIYYGSVAACHLYELESALEVWGPEKKQGRKSFQDE